MFYCFLLKKKSEIVCNCFVCVSYMYEIQEKDARDLSMLGIQLEKYLLVFLYS